MASTTQTQENPIFEPQTFINYEEFGLIWGNLGDCQVFLDKYTKSLEELENQGLPKNDKANSEKVAICHNNIASVYLFQGKYSKCLDHFNKAFTLYIESDRKRKNDLNVATIYHNLGWANVEIGLFDEAFEYTNKALKIRINLLEEVDPDVAISYNNLGVIYLEQGNTRKALQAHEKSLKIRNELYHEKPHPFLAESYCNKGCLLGELKRFTEALKCLNKAAEIFKDLYGENHRELALNANNKAYLLFKMGKHTEAYENYRKSLKIYMKLNNRTAQLGNVYDSLSAMHQKLFDIDRGLEYSVLSYQLFSKTLGKDHGSTILVRNYLKSLEQEKALSLKE